MEKKCRRGLNLHFLWLEGEYRHFFLSQLTILNSAKEPFKMYLIQFIKIYLKLLFYL